MHTHFAVYNKGCKDVSGNAGTDALEGHTLILLLRFYRKVRFVVLATGVRL